MGNVMYLTKHKLGCYLALYGGILDQGSALVTTVQYVCCSVLVHAHAVSPYPQTIGNKF